MVSGKGLGINRTQLLKLCDKHFKPNSEVMHIETKQEFNKLFNELESYSRLGLHNWHFTLYYSYGDKNMYIYLHQCCLKNIHPTNKESLLAFLSDFNELVDKKLTLKTKRDKVRNLKNQGINAIINKHFKDSLYSLDSDQQKLEITLYAFNQQNLIYFMIPYKQYKEIVPNLTLVMDKINSYENETNLPKVLIFKKLGLRVDLIPCRFSVYSRIRNKRTCKSKIEGRSCHFSTFKPIKTLNLIRRLKMLERTNLTGLWSAAKQEAESSPGVKKLVEYLEARGLKDVSPANMVLCLQQAHAVGFKGVPYLDFNTYQGWRAVGKQVKRGEECKIHTITWCASKPKGDADAEAPKQDKGKVWPKLTYLFHISQCE